MRKPRRRSSTTSTPSPKKEDSPSRSSPPLYRSEWLSPREYQEQSEEATRKSLTELVLKHPEELEKTIGTRYQLIERQRNYYLLSWSIGIILLLATTFILLHGAHFVIRNGMFNNVILKALLLVHPADEVDSWGESLLHALCESPSPQLSTYMLLKSYGLSLNRMDLFGRTPLHICAAKSVSIALQMLSDGAQAPQLGQRTLLNIVFDAMPTSSRVRDPALLLQFLDKIVETHTPFPSDSLNIVTPSNSSVLCKCYLLGRSFSGFFTFCDRLVALGADLNDPQSCRGELPLLHQVLEDTALLLLRQNASLYFEQHLLKFSHLNVNTLDIDGQNAGFHVHQVSHFDSLLANRLDISCISHGGENLLDHHMKKLAKYPTVEQALLLARIYESGVTELAATNIRSALVIGNDSATESLKLSKHVDEMIRFAKAEHRLPQLRGLSAVAGQNKRCFEEHSTNVIYVYENSYLEQTGCPTILALPEYAVKIAAAVDRIPSKEDVHKSELLEGGKRHVLPLIRPPLSYSSVPCEAVYLRAAVSPANVTSVTIEIDGSNVQQ